jgi:hypothetical protein
MAKLKTRNRKTRPAGPAPSSEPLPLHEGPRPDHKADPDAYKRWLQIRSARHRREVGTDKDPRHALRAYVK